MGKIAKIREHHRRAWAPTQDGKLPSSWLDSPEVLGLSHAVRDIYRSIAHFVDRRLKPFAHGYVSENQLAALCTAHPRTALEAEKILVRVGLIAKRHRHADVDTRRNKDGEPIPWFFANRIALLPPPSLRTKEQQAEVDALLVAWETPERIPWGLGRKPAAPVVTEHDEEADDEVDDEPVRQAAPVEAPRALDLGAHARAVQLWREARAAWGWDRSEPHAKEIAEARDWIETIGDRAIGMLAEVSRFVRKERPNWHPNSFNALKWAVKAVRAHTPAPERQPARQASPVALSWQQLAADARGISAELHLLTTTLEAAPPGKWTTTGIQLSAAREARKELGAVLDELVWAETAAETGDLVEEPNDAMRAQVERMRSRLAEIRAVRA